MDGDPIDLDYAFPILPIDLEQVIKHLKVIDPARFDLYVEAATCLLKGEKKSATEHRLRDMGADEQNAAVIVRDTAGTIRKVSRRSGLGALLFGFLFVIMGVSTVVTSAWLALSVHGKLSIVGWGLVLIGLFMAGHGIYRIFLGMRRLLLG